MREKRLDLFMVRIIACLMVITTHLSANPMVAGVHPHTFYKIMNASSKFCVPLFVFLTAFLLEYNYEKRVEYGRYYFKILKRLVFPYLLWVFAYYIYFVFRGIYQFNLKQLAVGVITGNIVFHLYYMLIAIQLYVFYPIIRKIRDAIGYIPLFAISLLAVLYSGIIPHFQIMLSNYLLYALIGMWVFSAESKWESKIGGRAVDKVWMGLLGGLMYLGTVFLFYHSYSPQYIIYQKMYILGSCTGIISIYLIAHSLNSLGKHLNQFLLYLIQTFSNATATVYYAHVFLMLFLAKIVPSERMLLSFFVQFLGIVLVWIGITTFDLLMNSKKRIRI